MKDGEIMIVLKNDNSGKSKNIATGFSVAILIFNYFVPLLRGEFSIAGKIFGVELLLFFICRLLNFSENMIGGVWWLFSLILALSYNKWRVKRLINKGFVPANLAAKKWLDDNGIIVMREVTFVEEAASVENSDVDNETKELRLSTVKETENVKDNKNTFVPPPPVK